MRRYEIHLISAVFFLTLSGCVSKEQFYDDVSLSRESAYKQWEVRKAAEKQAQTVIAGKLSLEDCLKLTLTNNKALLRTLEEKEAASGNELGAYSAILPNVALSAGYQRVDERPYFTFGSQTVTLGAFDNYSAALQVTQPIFA
jgi:outer membrane protein TolC